MSKSKRNSNKKLLFRLLLVTLTVFLYSEIVPALIKKATEDKFNYPFTYYSSIKKQFTFTEVSKDSDQRYTTDGTVYTKEGFDTIVPMFFYRQAMSVGALPDSIDGVVTDMRNIRVNSFFYRYNPEDFEAPTYGLEPMYESYPKRLKLETPPDLFRITDRIEFIDIESNSIDVEKSMKWEKALLKRGFTFPAEWFVGNPTTRKSYDEGWFAKDAKGKLFHMKMVNGKPFIKDTKVDETIDLKYMQSQEVSSRRFYGFVYDMDNNMYFLETLTYKLVQLPVKVDISKDKVLIMANPLYWNISVTNPEMERVVAVRNEDLAMVEEVEFTAPDDLWKEASVWLCPILLKYSAHNSYYVYPRIVHYSVKGLLFGLILALIFLFLQRRRKSRIVWWEPLIITLTGLPGLIAICLFPESR